MRAFSGEGTASSSGSVCVLAANGGTNGVTGRLSFSSGTTRVGNSGSVYFGSCYSSTARGGSIVLAVGCGSVSGGVVR